VGIDERMDGRVGGRMERAGVNGTHRRKGWRLLLARNGMWQLAQARGDVKTVWFAEMRFQER
jgi:hypothetical protein